MPACWLPRLIKREQPVGALMLRSQLPFASIVLSTTATRAFLETLLLSDLDQHILLTFLPLPVLGGEAATVCERVSC